MILPVHVLGHLHVRQSLCCFVLSWIFYSHPFLYFPICVMPIPVLQTFSCYLGINLSYNPVSLPRHPTVPITLDKSCLAPGLILSCALFMHFWATVVLYLLSGASTLSRKGCKTWQALEMLLQLRHWVVSQSAWPSIVGPGASREEIKFKGARLSTILSELNRQRQCITEFWS